MNVLKLLVFATIMVVVVVHADFQVHPPFGNGPEEFSILLPHPVLYSQLRGQLNAYIATRPHLTVRVMSVGVLETAQIVHETNASRVGDIVFGVSMTSGMLATHEPETATLAEWIPLDDYFAKARTRLGYPLQRAMPATAQGDCLFNKRWYCLPWLYDVRGHTCNVTTFARIGRDMPTGTLARPATYEWSTFFSDMERLATVGGVSKPYLQEPFSALPWLTALLQSHGLDLIDPKTLRSNLRHPAVRRLLDEYVLPMFRRSPDMARMWAGKWFGEHYAVVQNGETPQDYADVDAYENTTLSEWPATRALWLRTGTGNLPSRVPGCTQVGGSGSPLLKRSMFPGHVTPRLLWVTGLSRRSTDERRDRAWDFLQWLYDYSNETLSDTNSWQYRNVVNRAVVLNDAAKRSSHPLLMHMMTNDAVQFRDAEWNRALSFFFPLEAVRYTWRLDMSNVVGRIALDAIHADAPSTDEIIERASALIDSALHPELECADPRFEWSASASQCVRRTIVSTTKLRQVLSNDQISSFALAFFFGLVSTSLVAFLLMRGVSLYCEQRYRERHVESASVGTRQRAGGYRRWFWMAGFVMALGTWMTITAFAFERSFVAADGNIEGSVNLDAKYVDLWALLTTLVLCLGFGGPLAAWTVFAANPLMVAVLERNMTRRHKERLMNRLRPYRVEQSVSASRTTTPENGTLARMILDEFEGGEGTLRIVNDVESAGGLNIVEQQQQQQHLEVDATTTTTTTTTTTATTTTRTTADVPPILYWATIWKHSQSVSLTAVSIAFGGLPALCIFVVSSFPSAGVVTTLSPISCAGVTLLCAFVYNWSYFAMAWLVRWPRYIPTVAFPLTLVLTSSICLTGATYEYSDSSGVFAAATAAGVAIPYNWVLMAMLVVSLAVFAAGMYMLLEHGNVSQMQLERKLAAQTARADTFEIESVDRQNLNKLMLLIHPSMKPSERKEIASLIVPEATFAERYLEYLKKKKTKEKKKPATKSALDVLANSASLLPQALPGQLFGRHAWDKNASDDYYDATFVKDIDLDVKSVLNAMDNDDRPMLLGDLRSHALITSNENGVYFLMYVAHFKQMPPGESRTFQMAQLIYRMFIDPTANSSITINVGSWLQKEVTGRLTLERFNTNMYDDCAGEVRGLVAKNNIPRFRDYMLDKGIDGAELLEGDEMLEQVVCPVTENVLAATVYPRVGSVSM